MENKRSKGVTFWAWLFIIVSIFGLVDAMLYLNRIQEEGVGLFLFTILSGVAYITCGIFLLKLKEPARKAVIYLGILSIIAIPFYLTPTLKNANFEDYNKRKQAIIEQVKPEHQQAALDSLQNEDNATKKALPFVIFGIVGIPILILELIPIWLFTRPKVREQFS